MFPSFSRPQLLACVAAFGLAGSFGCGQGLVGDSNASALSTLGGKMGVDYSWARPSPASLHAAGYSFAARYVSDDSGKNMSRGETDALRAAGVDVVANWEDNGHQEILNGYNSGVYAAQHGLALANSSGMPAGRPIYFSIDFDASTGEQGSVNSFFDGAAAVLGRDRVGAYGGYGPVNRLFNAGKIKYAWQTYAWSGGNWDSRAQVRQIDNGAACGGQCDVDEAVGTDFGQWGVKPAAPVKVPCGLNAGQSLVEGESVKSCNGKFELAMQTDGNLVVYQLSPVRALWQSGTSGTTGHEAVMQTDGNLVVYNTTGHAIWDAKTSGNTGSALAMQDDGNLVLYGPGPTALWETNAFPPAQVPCGLQIGQQLRAGQVVSSCDKVYSLAMQTDGNFVLYHNGRGALWSTQTNGKGGSFAAMQTDGNLVVYTATGRAVWNSGTFGHPNSALAVQTDGNLVVYGPGEKALWQSGTAGR